MSTTTRREFLSTGTFATAGLLAATAASAVRAQEDPPHQHRHEDSPGADGFPREVPGAGGPVGSDTDRGKLVPGRRSPDEPPMPVVAPDLDKLSWELKDGIKEFHLYARHTQREFLPGMSMDVWCYNDSMPGPTIEASEGDRIRIVLHNELPEPTTLHLHGLELENRMDGVPGLTQDPIMPGESFVYELALHQNGTFFYHSHGAMQEAMGMVGLFIIHPRATYAPAVDRDFALILQEWAILPGATIPNSLSMEFNFFTINGRSGPYMTPMLVRLGDRVRIRLVNFSVIDHHPMHIHGVTFWVTGTEGGRIPESAWIPGNNVLVGVAQVREIEFIANNPGDWVLHCHMFHHMMNHMTSMVGMAGGHTRKGMPAGLGMDNSMGMLTRGPALSEELGPALGRGLGEQTGNDRTARNGPIAKSEPAENGRPASPSAKGRPEGHGVRPEDSGRSEQGGHKGMKMDGDASQSRVPGYPQDMNMVMYSEEQLAKLNRPETRGMREGWFRDVTGLMTVVRILPPDLYDRIVSGEEDVPAGASVPGSGLGKKHEAHHH